MCVTHDSLRAGRVEFVVEEHDPPILPARRQQPALPQGAHREHATRVSAADRAGRYGRAAGPHRQRAGRVAGYDVTWTTGVGVLIRHQ